MEDDVDKIMSYCLIGSTSKPLVRWLFGLYFPSVYLTLPVVVLVVCAVTPFPPPPRTLHSTAALFCVLLFSCYEEFPKILP